MIALTTLFPVFFMLALGFVSRIKGWVSPEQKAGANTIIFKILFPILVFSLMCSATIEATHIQVIAYVFIVYILALIMGKLVTPLTGKKYAHFSPYLLTVVEGGNVALPLYLSIVGTSSNTVIFDIAGTIVCFVIFPVLIAKEAATGSSTKEMIKNIFTNSFVIAVILGLGLNLTGVYGMLLDSQFGAMITNTLSQATTPIVSMILFILGYDLNVDKKTIVPILKLMSVKIVYYALVIAGFFILFPELMADKIFMMAPIIYFMAPTGFGLMPVIAPLYKDEEDASFTSAFVSMFIIVTLVVYTLVVVFIA
ncbi:AEC family transporter [Thomasclavelia sp.]|uniref:AEC family transporter n=1 Tax=Thomasclavelia sp. TaxID=3025757 RepID=UPI0025DE7335|nr:AEC family transporter [Thomasclavelia sp.]